MNHEERHLVSNMIGTPDMRIEVGPAVELAPRDTLLLASDGLFDNLHLDEIVARVRKGPLKKTIQTLAEDCRQRMMEGGHKNPSKPDDLTFIVFRSKAKKLSPSE
jgi:serine/threonine protein phosphatase PrpC